MLTINDHEFERVVNYVRERYGINLAKKRALVQARLALEVEKRGYASFGQYFDEVMLRQNTAEGQRMIDRLSTNHTYFFREPGCFDHMKRAAVPALLARGVRELRVWCAASSTGQECYTIAMMLEEALMARGDASYRILASDINSEVLDTARRAVYPVRELETIPERFRRLWCRSRDDNHFEITPALRERVCFEPINLAMPLRAIPPQHLIFCRNVMIYFSPDAKEALTSELYRLVSPNGFVYVGSTETLDLKRARFRYVEPSVFQKTPQAQK